MQLFHGLGDESGINRINIETDGGKALKAVDVGVPVPLPLPLDSIGLKSLTDVTVEFTTFKFDDDQAKVLGSLNNENIVLKFSNCELPLDKDGRNILFDAMRDSQGRSKFRFFDTEILVGIVGGGRNAIKQHDQRVAGLMLLALEPDIIGSLCIDSSHGGRMIEYDELIAYMRLSGALGTRLEKPDHLAAKNGVNWDAKILVKNHNLGSICEWEPKLTKTGDKCKKCYDLGRFCSSHQSKGSAILEQLGYKTTVSATQFLTL
jgi:hypothetical protein